MWPSNGCSWDELVRRVQLAEELGFDGVWGFDHFQPMYGEGPGETFEGMTTLAALAGLTSRIRLGLLVTGVTYRHPSVLAAQALTIDHASHGRLELSLGAAWFDKEHHELGIPFPSTGERFDLLEDALEIVTRLFTGEVVSYEGDVVSLRRRPAAAAAGAAPAPADLDRRHRPDAAPCRSSRGTPTCGTPGARRTRCARPTPASTSSPTEAGRDPPSIMRAGSLSLDDLDTARKHAAQVARRRLRLPRVRLARGRRVAGRGLRPRRHARVHLVVRTCSRRPSPRLGRAVCGSGDQSPPSIRAAAVGTWPRTRRRRRPGCVSWCSRVVPAKVDQRSGNVLHVE